MINFNATEKNLTQCAHAFYSHHIHIFNITHVIHIYMSMFVSVTILKMQNKTIYSKKKNNFLFVTLLINKSKYYLYMRKQHPKVIF